MNIHVPRNHAGFITLAMMTWMDLEWWPRKVVVGDDGLRRYAHGCDRGYLGIHVNDVAFAMQAFGNHALARAQDLEELVEGLKL